MRSLERVLLFAFALPLLLPCQRKPQKPAPFNIQLLVHHVLEDFVYKRLRVCMQCARGGCAVCSTNRAAAAAA